MRRFHVLTAEQFIEQGTSPAAILSIASVQADRDLRSHLEDVARVVSLDTGLVLRSSLAGYQRAYNDNKRSRRAA